MVFQLRQVSSPPFLSLADEQFLAVCNASIVNGPGYLMESSDFTTVTGRLHVALGCYPEKGRVMGDPSNRGWCSSKSTRVKLQISKLQSLIELFYFMKNPTL